MAGYASPLLMAMTIRSRPSPASYLLNKSLRLSRRERRLYQALEHQVMMVGVGLTLDVQIAFNSALRAEHVVEPTSLPYWIEAQ